MSSRAEVSLTDEELRTLHREVLDNCPPSFGNVLIQSVLDMLPKRVQRAIVSPEDDPREAPIRTGEILAGAIGLVGPDRMILAVGFGSHVQRIASGRLKSTFTRGTAPRTSTSSEYGATTNQIIRIGERLATVFTLPDLDPDAMRQALHIAALDLPEDA